MATTPDPATAIVIPTDRGPLAARSWAVADAHTLYVFGHGAGAGMHHPFMVDVSRALAERGIATLRWEMPAFTAGRRFADRPAVVRPLARAAVEYAAATAPGVRLIAGGKSMGGRMTSEALADAPIAAVAGLAFLGFPLHPAGAPAITRADHLDRVGRPMLFVSGQRDALATPTLLAGVIARLGAAATLVSIPDADHGLEVPRRAGFDPIARAADAIAAWAGALPAPPLP